ncbi:hypothetical protein KP509_11G013300 [Ceratopteris richardii]|uniref:Pentatricopeptide repeat-containing protein n=1 Tax=Ceratopteris richardii TaxID=49495 RepID=A0A8T2TS03_CERRI|nr:hypothetical protein KP509_11G013300 [Ceratopteris richardii]KAH7424544.1 hypothetical protein KP509_11G013300 [Ceratopteris richardii]KAH7424545.1 hypothetical protein KP509_11G013300 [Ceratopteris richardii]
MVISPCHQSFVSGEAICSYLQQCIRTKCLLSAHLVHCAIIRANLDAVPELQSLLIHAYGVSGSLSEAHSVFLGASPLNSCAWNAIISAYVNLGKPQQALGLYQAMWKQRGTPNSYVFLYAAKACSNLEVLEQGMAIHMHVVQFGFDSDVAISTTLVDMYAKCGYLEEAQNIFFRAPHVDNVLWNALISGYVKHGEDLRALELFEQMQGMGYNPDRYIYSCILKALGNLRALWQAMEMHKELLVHKFEWDKVIASTLVDTYASCGALAEARKVFDSLSDLDKVLWGSVIASYVQNGQSTDALHLFKKFLKKGHKPDKFIYTSMLKACAGMIDFSHGRLLHELFVKMGFDQDEAIGNALIDMYSNWKSPNDAQKVFDRMQKRSVITWNSMIAAYADNADADLSVDVFERMQYEGYLVDNISITNTLQACVNACALEEGMRIHDYILKIAIETGRMVVNTLIDFYAKCYSLDEACAVFDTFPNKDVVTWNAMLSGCVHCGHADFALKLFASMYHKLLQPDASTYSQVIKACGYLGVPIEGFLVHLDVLHSNHVLNPLVGNALVDMYCKLSLIDEACKLFELLPNKNIVAWNSIIAGQAQQGLTLSAIQTFERMDHEGPLPDAVTFQCALRACGMLCAAYEGRLIHNQIIACRLESDTSVANTLLDAYVKCGRLSEAQCIFASLKNKNLVSYNAMIAGLSRLDDGQEVFNLFEKLQLAGIQPDEFTYSSIIKACSNREMINEGQLFHIEVVKLGLDSNPVINSSLLDMYVSNAMLDECQKLVQSLPGSDLISSNEMVWGYVNHGLSLPALAIFNEMQEDGLQPDKITYSNILKACSSREDLTQGRLIHEQIRICGIKVDKVTGSALIDMYAKCGSLTEARQVFDEFTNRDIIMWSTMIGGYVHHNQYLPALELFAAFLQEGRHPDHIMYLSVLKASSHLGAVGHGLVLHDLIVRSGFESDSMVRSTLIDMYSKLGSLCEANKLYQGSQNRTIESWTAMISGYVKQSDPELAKRYMDAMREEGWKPDEKAYASILSGFGHVARLDDGKDCFRCMTAEHRITPMIQHFNCLVDLLGRAGCLDDAVNILETLPDSDVFAGWVSLLSACNTFGNDRLGTVCFKALADSTSPCLVNPVLVNSEAYHGIKEICTEVYDARHTREWK